MKGFCFVIVTFLLAVELPAQLTVAPGGEAFDKSKIRNGRTEMAYYSIKNGVKSEVCSYRRDVKSDDKTYAVFSVLTFLHSGEQWIDTSISDSKTFRPLYRSSYHATGDYALTYGKEVTGYYMGKPGSTRKVIKETAGENYFDSYTYPYLLGLLPLASGYKTTLSVYEYKPVNIGNVKNVKVSSVTNSSYASPYTGAHKVCQVSVLEEATGDRYEYYIDKEFRRIWKIDIQSNGLQVMLVDKEIDYQPIASTFDKEATMKMITEGRSIIEGEAFARDNANGSAMKSMAVLNINKKQYAPQGTGILLVPYTDYFREWIKVNEAARKKGRAEIPLPDDVRACMKMTTVYDAKGSFEFVNLMPGKYMVYTAFNYVHQGSRTDVVGYTDTYINGNYQGSTANTNTYSVFSGTTASVEKVITIDKDGETVSTKLKKTR